MGAGLRRLRAGGEPAAYHLVHPAWRTAQAAAVARAVAERGVPLAVIGTGGGAGHAPARALYERHGFTGLPLVRYYRPL